MAEPAYKRIMLKLSGEAIVGENGQVINFDVVGKICDQIIQVVQMGIEVGIVIGAGNIWRGRQGSNMDRTTADYMGMLATGINALALQDAMEQRGVPTRVLSAIEMRAVAEPYIRRRAVRHLEKGRVVIFACGTGNPFFSTDTTAALRAAEIDAEAILLAKNVDGVYDSDPKVNPNAKRFSQIDYIDVLNRGLTVMDTTAITLCMDNKIPIVVFGLNEENSIRRAVMGEEFGTRVGALL
ncbi:UMP kinase [Christensenellaceae bacterium NSJ-44]|uniref:Uridylate kinase n=1 Tax=Luoshenia tenuis TaxID=2763654 RepID=A0A926HIP5_9FIRM|nr:UMP kinase [Luoshenia tenuis]MBC8529022.1 UMP kinase [Luoshenia tenuis]SCJ14933.1 Uridylate kinase [uncultured Clostridium sp.]